MTFLLELRFSVRFDAIFTFSAVSSRLHTTPFNFVGLLAYLGYGRPVIPRSVCDLGVGCQGLVHLAPPAVI